MTEEAVQRTTEVERTEVVRTTTRVVVVRGARDAEDAKRIMARDDAARGRRR